MKSALTQKEKQLDFVLSRELNEQETTITIMRNEEYAEIYVSDNTMLTKIRKLVLNNPSQWVVTKVEKDSDNNYTGFFIQVPKNFISFKLKNKELSEEVRAQAAERMKKARESLVKS